MPSSQINICDLIHTFSRHSLKLTSSCVALFSYDSDLLKSVDIFRVAFSNPFEALWIDIGAGLHILVNIKTDGISMNDSDREDFVVKLGVILRDPKFWSQFDLQAFLTLSTDDDITSGTHRDVSLRLVHLDSEITSKTEEAPISNARPPDGVPCATLHEIQITFSLAKTVNERSRKKVKKPIQDNNTLLDNDEDCILEYPFFSQPDLLLPYMGWDEEINKHKFSSQSSATDIAEMLDDEEAPRLQIQDHECCVASRADSSAQSVQQRDYLGNGKRSISDTTLSYSDISASYQLIYIAIHKMICDKRIRKPLGIEAIAVSPGPKLADIAPAIFSPGYLKAMSERSYLIPTIANSLVSIFRRAKTDLLKSALIIYLKPSMSVGLDDERPPIQADQISRNEIAAAIKARLWEKAQRGLYDPLAACRLKPLETMFDKDSLHLGLNEMLEKASSPRTVVNDSNSLDSPWLDLMGCDHDYDDDNDEKRLQMLFNEDALQDDVEDDEIFDGYENVEELERQSLYTLL